MRTKQLWFHCDVPAKASLVWSRITFSRLTTSYFILAIFHCAIQIIFQAQAFAINAAAVNRLWSFVAGANDTQEANGFAILANDLRICYTVPTTINTDSCQVIWDGNNQSGPSFGMAAASLSASVTPSATQAANNSVAAVTFAASVTSAPASSAVIATSSASVTSPSSLAASKTAASASSFTVVIAPTAGTQNAKAVVVVQSGSDEGGDNNDEKNGAIVEHQDRRRSLRFKRMVEVSSDVVNGTTGVEVYGLHGSNVASNPQHLAADMGDSTFLSDTCIKSLIWPVQRLSDTKREDITFIGFQVWVLGMSIVALLNESIPHICAALVTHLLVTIWTVFQLFETERFRQDFARLTTNGACSPTNLLGTYWDQRRNAEIPSAVLNGVALLASAFLTFKLMKIYGWQTFKRVGASLTINRVYKLVLSLSISIQLALFFIVAAMALWIDQLYQGSIGRLATLSTVYKGTFIAVFCLLVPWLALGWFAVRREMRKLAIFFLVLSLLFIGLWAAMFKSYTFRWTFVSWHFFTVMAIVSGILMITTFILGLACLFNFGKGLPRYLNAEEPLEGDDFSPVYPEKHDYDDDPEIVDFPSSNGRPVPTFSATFGSGPEVPKPTQMRFGPARDPGMGMYGDAPGYQPGYPDHQRSQSLARSMTSSTSSSSRSARYNPSLARTETRGSQMTHKSGSSASSGRTDAMGKRWVIE